MTPDDFDALLLTAMRMYRGAMDTKAREENGERFSIPDIRLRQLALAEATLDQALRAVRAQRK